jgi:hypothetical protein
MQITILSTIVIILLVAVGKWRPKTLPMLLMLFIFGISHAEERNSNSDVVSLEEYKVYADLMNHPKSKTWLPILDLRHGTVVIEEMTSPRKKWSDSSFSRLERASPPGKLDPGLMDDLNRKNNRAYKIESRFPKSTPQEVDMIPAEVLDEMFGKNDGWRTFYRRYPKAGGILTLSRVGFNHEKTAALLYAGVQSDWLAGAGYLILFEKQSDKWVVTKRESVWIS